MSLDFICGGRRGIKAYEITNLWHNPRLQCPLTVPAFVLLGFRIPTDRIIILKATAKQDNLLFPLKSFCKCSR